MSEQEIFRFRTLNEVRRRIEELGIDLELSEDLSSLFQPVTIGAKTLSNRFVVLPMEGCDGTPDGAPDELTFRRYRRFASGGAGLLWLEATAVVREGRANPRQLWLHEATVGAFSKLADETRKAAREALGPSHQPLLIVQLTQSGRYSRPGRKPQPIIAHHSPYLDPIHNLPPDYPLITDEELERLEDSYVAAAECAMRAGFDGVDVKACHRYLVSELLASHTREISRYGGDFENRSRFLRNVVLKIRSAVPGLIVTSRMNAFDAMAYPYGFGVDRNDPPRPDLAEAKELVRFLRDNGAPFVNITIGNPYYNPYVNRPFDRPVIGGARPPESPLRGIERFVAIVREIQQATPHFPIIGGGYSWLRQFFAHLGAANVRKGWVSLIGMGRMAFAYPECVRDLAEHGKMNPAKCCVACSACSQIMRDGGCAGCVPRDAAVYKSIYQAGRADALDAILEMANICRQCAEPDCVAGCPARVDIPRFIGLISERKFREAYAVLRDANVLTTVCGYVCPSEELCEKQCISQYFTESVPIRHLQRWVSRKAVEEGWAGEPHTPARVTGKKVAVVGAGPAGLSAATKLAALGHRVILFNRSIDKGGAAQTVIPEDRLPEALLQREIAEVLTSFGDLLEHRTQSLGADYDLDQLLAEGFDAALLAPGLSQSAALPKSSRPVSGVEGALEFLARVKKGDIVSGVVFVLGGGNTAIDAALTAREAGAEDVSIIYRRSLMEMPAWAHEREQAIHSGVSLILQTAPMEYIVDAGGKLTGLKVIRTRLGPSDSKGRRLPLPIPGTEHVLPADLIIEAFGQQIDEGLRQALHGISFTDQGLIWTQGDGLETSRAGVFAAGDAVNGGTTIVQAVAEGVRAAMAIHARMHLN